MIPRALAASPPRLPCRKIKRRRRSTCGGVWPKKGVLFRDVPGNELRHFEHADLGLAIEHGLQLVIAIDLRPDLLVLQTILLDVIPEFLGELGARQRLAANDSGEKASGVTGAMNLAFGIRAGSLP